MPEFTLSTLIRECVVYPLGFDTEAENWYEMTVWGIQVRWAGPRHLEDGYRSTGGWYACRLGGWCLSRAGKWARPERYQTWQYRFATYQEAEAAAVSASRSFRVNGLTWDEFTAWRERQKD